MEKKCSKCQELKDLNEFHKDQSRSDGYEHWCKKCKKEDRKRYRENNKEKIKEYGKKYILDNKELLAEKRLENRDEYNQQQKLRYKNDLDYRQKLKDMAKNWKCRNPEKVREHKKRYKKKYKLRHSMSKSIQKKLKYRGGSKNGTSWEIALDYSHEDLKNHLESLFRDGMSWENYGAGQNKWCIDHIVPDSHFSYSSMQDDDFQKSWSLSNLQPMWFNKNSSKGNKYSGKYNSSK